MYFATLLAIVASPALAVGLYCMKRAAERLPAFEGGWRPTVWWAFVRDPLWLLGLVLQIVGYALYLTALRGAPLSVVHTALNGGVALFVLMAVVGLGERLRPFEWAGVGMVVVGLIVLGCSLTDTAASGSAARGTLPFSLVLMALCVLALAVDRAPRRAVGLSIATGLMLGLASVFAKALAGADSLAAAIWSQNLVLTLAANLLGFGLMQGALQAGRGVVVVPIFSTLSNTVPIIGGILLYGEWEASHGVTALLRPLAFVLAIGGAALLAGFSERQSTGPAAAPHFEEARSR
jgi:multidrug transporter EmrE-like cation transporter